MNTLSRTSKAKRKAISLMTGISMAFTLFMTQMFMMTASAAGNNDNLGKITKPIEGLLNSILNVAIPLVGAVGAIFCVLLGVKFARAEEPQEREKAKQHLKNAIIGFVLIFVLIVALRLALPILTDWMNDTAPANSSSAAATSQG